MSANESPITRRGTNFVFGLLPCLGSLCCIRGNKRNPVKMYISRSPCLQSAGRDA